MDYIELMAKKTTTQSDNKTESKKATTPALGLFSKSYALVKENWRLVGLLYAPTIALAVLDTFDRISDENKEGYGLGNLVSNAVSGPNAGTVIGAEDMFIIFILNVLSILGAVLMLVASVMIINGKTPNLGAVWNGFTKNGLWLRLAGLLLLMGIAIVLGIFAFIIPGVYLIIRTFMAPYLMIDKNLGIEQALRQSWDKTKGYAWAILSVLAVMLLITLPSVLPAIGGLIAVGLTIIYTLAAVLRYKEIK